MLRDRLQVVEVAEVVVEVEEAEVEVAVAVEEHSRCLVTHLPTLLKNF